MVDSNSINIQRMDSMGARQDHPMIAVEQTDAPTGDGESTYANEEERQEAMHQFQLEQQLVTERQNLQNEQQRVAHEKLLELEAEVDEKVEDAIRHAQTTIEQTQAELDEADNILHEHANLLDKIHSEKEEISQQDTVKIAEYAAKYQEVQEKITRMEKIRREHKKMLRVQSDEVSRLSSFKRVRITKMQTQAIPTEQLGARLGGGGFVSHTQNRHEVRQNLHSGPSGGGSSQMPEERKNIHGGAHSGDTEKRRDNFSKGKILTMDEAQEVVSRLAQRKAHRTGCKCELCAAGGAVSHVKSFKPKKVRASYSKSRSRSRSSHRVTDAAKGIQAATGTTEP